MAANTLTGLIPVIYEALDVVSRELVGLVMAVSRDATAEMAAVDQTVRSPVVPAITPVAIVYGSYPVDEGEQTIGYVDMSISNAYQSPIKWNGEEQLSLGNMKDKILQQQFEQGMRAICNMIETDLAELYVGASRAYGTAGTTPFASDLSPAAQLRKILDDNGAPAGDRHIVIDTTSGASMRTLSGLNTQYAAGTDETLRRGTLLDIMGFSIRESGQIQSHTKGTMTGADCTAIEPVGETTIACDGSDSGTVLAGDIVTRGVEGGSDADSNKYVVYSGSTLTGAASGNMIIAEPGLRLATTVSDEWTIGGNYTANLAFSRNAIHLAARTPVMPDGGDAADDVMNVTDPISGLTFQFALYRLHRMVKIEIGMCWGCAVIKPEHLAILLG